MAFRVTSTSLQSVQLLPYRDFKGVTSASPSTPLALAISIAATSVTRAGPVGGASTVTFTATAEHRLVDGQEVTIAGASPVQYNGRFVISVTSPTVFKYTLAADPGAASGTITATYTPMAQWAFIVADKLNGATISIGSNSKADFWEIAAGDGFTLPLPHGAKADLTQFYVQSANASQNYRVLFV